MGNKGLFGVFVGVMLLIVLVVALGAKAQSSYDTLNGPAGYKYLGATTGSDAIVITMQRPRPDGGTDFVFIDVKTDGSVKYYDLKEN